MISTTLDPGYNVHFGTRPKLKVHQEWSLIRNVLLTKCSFGTQPKEGISEKDGISNEDTGGTECISSYIQILTLSQIFCQFGLYCEGPNISRHITWNDTVKICVGSWSFFLWQPRIIGSRCQLTLCHRLSLVLETNTNFCLIISALYSQTPPWAPFQLCCIWHTVQNNHISVWPGSVSVDWSLIIWDRLASGNYKLSIWECWVSYEIHNWAQLVGLLSIEWNHIQSLSQHTWPLCVWSKWWSHIECQRRWLCGCFNNMLEISGMTNKLHYINDNKKCFLLVCSLGWRWLAHQRSIDQHCWLER